MEVVVKCPMCKQNFTLRINYTPKVTFSWSATKGFLYLELSSSAIEHVCERP